MKKKSKLGFLLQRFSFQLPLFFFLASFLAILVFCGVLYYAMSHLLLGEAISHTQNMLQMSSTNIATYVRSLKAESNLFAANPALVAYLAGEDLGRETELNLQMQAMLNSNPAIQSIVAVSRDGRVLSNEQGLDMTVCENMMMEQWYTDAIQNTMPVLTGARMQTCSSSRDNWVISVSREVKTTGGENAGVLRIDMNYGVIEELLHSLALGQQGYVFILNEADEPVYHKDPAYFQNPEKTAELLSLKQQGASYNPKNNTLTSQTEIENTGWIMVGVVQLDNLKLLQRHLFETVVFTGLLLLGSGSLLGLLFTRRLSRPMQRLEKNMSQIEKLAEMAPDAHGFYEMELFTAHYNQMIRRIRNLLDELREKEKNLSRLELQVLMDQINPHFLYNTLDTIVWMAEFNDSARVIALTKSLASFFRLSLGGGKEMVTVREELAHVRQYLYIQKERYEDKFEYFFAWDEEALSCPIPKIILQPLAENSIYHGIKPLVGSGSIHITARVVGDDILLTVQDNGVGFAPGVATQNSPTPKHGVGLQNVQSRIALYYGEKGGFQLDTAPGRGCTVTLRIPQNGPNEP